VRLPLAAALVAAVAVTGAAAAQDPEIPTRDCRSRGDASDGSAVRFAGPADVVVGPISFASLRAARSPTAVYRRGDGRWFRKAGAKVLWGRAVTLTVTAADRDGLRLEYTRPATSSVRFEPCPPGTMMFGGNGRLRRVTAFPGGFSFDRRGCYELEVRVERGRTYRRTISLGSGRC
jgi:hypothetical protein